MKSFPKYKCISMAQLFNENEQIYRYDNKICLKAKIFYNTDVKATIMIATC